MRGSGRSPNFKRPPGSGIERRGSGHKVDQHDRLGPEERPGRALSPVVCLAQVSRNSRQAQRRTDDPSRKWGSGKMEDQSLWRSRAGEVTN
ncbi:hypothetical protein NDU88_004305 [Pleurodeles waltl]|uniref:Uncharacterized protein n=1 Tax=Pleurodeles waltl TaxID=8319 RepID=A0AAV7W7G6_PLEWA|nr:hypothetical protein NDU88_004305 [Pleurodeles waltl]